MCFSAEVSFSAAAVLLLMGAACFSLKLNKRFYLIALIPVLFGIQQFSEGLVWLYSLQGKMLGTYGSILFLTFAFMIWPIWMPLSSLCAETIPWRRGVMALLLFLGVGLSIYYAFLGRDGLALTIGHTIYYQSDHEGYPHVYLLVTVLPFLISSVPYLWAVALVILLGYIATIFYFLPAFVSVWCFFAAITSTLLYFVLRNAQKHI